MFLTLFYLFFFEVRHVPTKMLVLPENNVRLTFLFAKEGRNFVNGVFFTALKKPTSSYLSQRLYADKSHQIQTGIAS